MIVFKYRVTGERGVRYLCMLGEMYAAQLYDHMQHRNQIPEEFLIKEMALSMRDGMTAKLTEAMKVHTEYDRLAISHQLHQPIEVSVFELGEFVDERRAEQVVNDYRNDTLALHEDGCPERVYHV